jgi:hypothetical protein
MNKYFFEIFCVEENTNLGWKFLNKGTRLCGMRTSELFLAQPIKNKKGDAAAKFSHVPLYKNDNATKISGYFTPSSAGQSVWF